MRKYYEKDDTWNRITDSEGASVAIPYCGEGADRGAVDGLVTVYWLYYRRGVELSCLLWHLCAVSQFSG